MGIATKDVPWEYDENRLFRSWSWDTPHFKAVVFSEGDAAVIFNWKVEDFTDSRSGRELAAGQAISYADAADAVLEVVGKSYPPTLQYKEYAGPLATTYTIGTSEVIDFGEMESHKVTLIVRDGDSDVAISGSLACVHYEIHITTDSGQIVKIPPLLIQEVRGEFSSTAVKGKDAETKRDERARIYSGNWVQGCTGRNGFTLNTVEHDPRDPWCPIHEKH